MDDKERNLLEDQGSDEALERPAELTQNAADAILECIGQSIEITREEAESIADEILDTFTTVKGERVLRANATVHTSGTSRSGFSGGRSIKAGNLLINIRDLAKTNTFVPATAAAATAYFGQHPALTIVLGLSALLNAVHSLRSLELSDRVVGVLHAMWQNRDNENSIAEEGLLEKVNKHFVNFEWSALNSEELIGILERLEKARCIETTDPFRSLMRTGVKYVLKEEVIVAF